MLLKFGLHLYPANFLLVSMQTKRYLINYCGPAIIPRVVYQSGCIITPLKEQQNGDNTFLSSYVKFNPNKEGLGSSLDVFYSRARVVPLQ